MKRIVLISILIIIALSTLSVAWYNSYYDFPISSEREARIYGKEKILELLGLENYDKYEKNGLRVYFDVKREGDKWRVDERLVPINLMEVLCGGGVHIVFDADGKISDFVISD